MQTDFKFRGHEAFAKGLDKMIDEEQVKRKIQRTGLDAQRRAVQLAPVDTANLKRMIRNYIEENGYQSRVTSEAEYAIYQELGTRKQSGTPHIYPAFDLYKVQFINEMRGFLKGG